MKKDPNAVFYVVSRSGKNSLEDRRVINIKADVSSVEDIRAKLPEHVDYMVNFVGCAAVPKGSTKTLEELNLEPAKVMRELAESYHVKAMGAIGGKLGSKEVISSIIDPLLQLSDFFFGIMFQDIRTVIALFRQPYELFIETADSELLLFLTQILVELIGKRPSGRSLPFRFFLGRQFLCTADQHFHSAV